MSLPTLKEKWTKPPASTVQAGIQTTAAIVVALATVFAVIVQSKDNPKFAGALVVLALAVVGWAFGSRVIASLQTRRVRVARDSAARTEYKELLRFARRFAQFTNTGDRTNIRPIIFSLCGNNAEKCAELCPPDYMRDLFPLFVQHLETRQSENESQFLLAAHELYGLVASYNRYYVTEPFERMRMKRWAIPNSSPVPELGTWIASLPLGHQESAGREIEDSRERWVRFLDDMKQWLERVNESFGASLPVWFERPHKL
ncbi:MAG: hypothetical protein DMG48_02845 [Acidobacteria bacterium]|nr:MAG: hypothetical protein DMG48_02845 [Acidobacteriota bacterium]